MTCGNSEEMCSIFEIDIEKSNAVVKDCDDYSKFEDEIKLAAECCPANAIKYLEE